MLSFIILLKDVCLFFSAFISCYAKNEDFGSSTVVKAIIQILIALLGAFYYLHAQEALKTSMFDMKLFTQHLSKLGSDSLEGRAPGTPGGNLAAKYLANEFAKIHLKQFSSKTKYYQHIPFHGSKALYNSKLNIRFGSEAIGFRLKEDFLMYNTNNPVFIPNETPMVFAGYGISAPEFDYNDYHDLDVEGKIVVFLDGEPYSEDPDYFNGALPSIYSLPESKQRIALSRGARGSILIPLYSNIKSDDWEKAVHDFSFENLTLATSPSTNFDIIINPQIAGLLFTGSGYTLNELLEMQSSTRVKSFPLNGLLTFQGSFKQRDFVSPNIIGIVEGDDANHKDTYVIVSAHYDHLGIGTAVKGDSIYNGVFDNAAGVSALLEIARVFSDTAYYKRRSIIFLLLTAEEYGLLGSEYYIQNPILPLYKTVANINIDGIASYDRFKSYVALGAEFSSIQSFVNNAAEIRGLKRTEISEKFKRENSFAKSDQFSFAKAGIPSILITEGTDYENISSEEGIAKLIEFARNIYHSPFDDLTQTINYDAVKQHIDFIFGVIDELVNSENKPEWNFNSPFRYARILSQKRLK
ncbi:MAG: putative aminopeptidase [Ignavibacteria bacterium]|nr:MAG: putative aminopeptidase [Ignavibacteria bacterium]KAF0160896.1 MAG: putative aminopeptidase [Ignavibacteria bacterium]